MTDSDQSDGESPQLFIAENLDPAQDHDDSGNQSSGSHQPPITLCSPNTAGNQPSVSSDGLDHGNQGFLDLSMTGGNSSERLRSALTTEASSKETEIVQKFISEYILRSNVFSLSHVTNDLYTLILILKY